MNKTSEEKLIHIKLDYNEGVQSKKDILKSQASLLRIVQIMKRYRPLRMEELKIKTRAHAKISEIIRNIKKLEVTLPKIKIPKILKEHHNQSMEELEEIEDKIIETKIRKYDSSLDSQLQEIQEKLRELAA